MLNPPINVFISHASEDEAHRVQLEKHLASLVREGVLYLHHRGMIQAGQDYARALAAQIDACSIALVLMSPDFSSSDYCNTQELSRIRDRSVRNQLVVVIVILRTFDWSRDFRGFTAFRICPENARPVTHWPDPDRAWLNVVRQVNAIVESMHGGGAPTSARPKGRSFVSETEVNARWSPVPPSARIPPPSTVHAPLSPSARIPPPPTRPSFVPMGSATGVPVPALSSRGGAARKRHAWPLTAVLLFTAATLGATGLSEGGWLRGSSSEPTQGPSRSVVPVLPPATVALQTEPPATVALRTECPASCCGGSDCVAPTIQVEAFRRARDGTVACASGRTCVSNSCDEPLAFDRAFLLRLARVDMAGKPLLGSRICFKKAGPLALETCLDTSDAADLPRAAPGAAMSARFPVTIADLLAGRGLDIAIDGAGGIVSQPAAVVDGSTVKTKALCIGLKFKVGPAAVLVYLDDP